MKKVLIFWNKIKTALLSLFNWFRHKKVPEILTRKAEPEETLRMVNTKQPGPNMPRYQSCPNGHGWKRRAYKTMGGAHYHCHCGDFFVRAVGA